MAANVPALLEKAKLIHRLPSDYKLALVMGISHSALTSYRQGKTLPDARVISLICDLTGDDAALLAAEIEEQRAKTGEARALWHLVAQRLQSAAAAAVFAVAFVLVGLVGLPMSDAHAKPAPGFLTSYTSWNVAGRFTRFLWRLIAPAARYLRGLTFQVLPCF